MFDVPQQSFRPKVSMLDVVKIMSTVTLLNLFLTITSFLSSTEESHIVDVDHPLELGRYHDEKLSIDVVPGAPLTFLKSEDVLTKSTSKPEYDLKELESDKNGIFISVRTTNKYHRSRLKILLDTWISEVPENVWIITDQEDNWLTQYIEENFKLEKPQIYNTYCPTTSDEKWSLLCKLHWEYRKFLISKKPWFCHFDDDGFVNIEMLVKLLSLYSPDDDVYIGRSPSNIPVTAMAYDTENVEPESFSFNETTNETSWIMPQATFQRVAFHYALGGAGFCISRQLALDMMPYALAPRIMHMAASIALPDDCVFGYIITYQLNVSLTSTTLMRTHMENLTLIPESLLHQQISLSYSVPLDTTDTDKTEKNTIENAENSMFFYRNSSDKNFIIPDKTKANVVDLDGYFSKLDDPTRFYSLHKLIYRELT